MLTAKDVKDFAKECGADLVGISPMDRFEGAPPEMDPRFIFPDAKVMIGMAFRIPRGYLRGIEEGTQFYQYPAMGYANINENYAPMVLHEVACFLEDHGYEGAVYRNTGGRGPVSDMTGKGPSESPELGRRLGYHEPVEEGKPGPDVQFHFRIAAYVCGLGEIGWSKVFLTPEFGPRQRFAFVMTDADLEPDPIYDGPPLCNRCMVCAKECPGHAISAEKSVKLTIAGREIEWGEVDEWQCFSTYMGSNKETNPFLPRDAFDHMEDGDKIIRGEKKLTPDEVRETQRIIRMHYPNASGYNNAMCGGRGCIRGCMTQLEKRDVLKNKFHQPFRKRKPWKLAM